MGMFYKRIYTMISAGHTNVIILKKYIPRANLIIINILRWVMQDIFTKLYTIQ